ncbi:MAG: glycosyltransferase family 4 protein [Pseudomonadota bacterium]
MRVLHFYKTSFPDTTGGVEQVINQIARGTSAFGVETEVLSLTSAKSAVTTTVDGYLTHRARLNFEIASTGFSIAAFKRFADLARHADVVHYHYPWPFMDVVHFATRMRKPCIVTYHSDIIRQQQLLQLYRPLKRRFLASVDRIVATSPNYLATSDVLQQFADKVTVIPIGIDKATYAVPTVARLDHWRQSFGPKFFLFVGVLRYYKGLHILLEAAQGTNFPIVIVGAGPIEQALKAQALALCLSNVHFLGQVSEEDKAALLTLCYGIVFPSHLRSEAFGVSLLEGAMFGKPMISSEIGTGTTFINIDGETGLVVPPDDVVALRQAMVYLWEKPEASAALGLAAERRYWRYFTAEQMVKSYVELYELVSADPDMQGGKMQ